jgi:hypothetical protein
MSEAYSQKKYQRIERQIFWSHRLRMSITLMTVREGGIYSLI